MEHSLVGQTVIRGDGTLGLVLSHEQGVYLVEFTDGRVDKTARVTPVGNVDLAPDIAAFRYLNPKSGQLALMTSGWDVIAIDPAEQEGMIWDPSSHTFIHRTQDPNNQPLHGYDPAWGLEPDSEVTYQEGSPETEDYIDGFNHVIPTPSFDKYDNSFPSTGVRSNMERDMQYFGHPTLGDCAQCGDPMNDNADGSESNCDSCGYRQPIDYTIARRRAMARAEHLALGITLPLELGAEAMGEGSASSGVSSLLGMTDDLIGAATRGTKGVSDTQGGGDVGDGGQSVNEEAASQPREAASDTENDWYATPNSGHDVEPDAGNKGFTDDVGDSPENLKDVNDTGGTSQGAGPEAEDAIQAAQLLQPLLQRWAEQGGHKDNPIIKGLDEALKGNFPEYGTQRSSFKIISIGEPMAPGAGGVTKMCPVCHQDPSLASNCPIGKTGNGCPIFGNTQQPGAQPPAVTQPMPGGGGGLGGFSHVEDQETETISDKIAARKPKMCPFHNDLVDLALEIGDPAQATSAMSRHMYTPNSCRGGWAGDDPRKPSKCRFKPAMIKQEFWDAKEAEAEERRMLREEQQQMQQPDPNAISPEVQPDQDSAVQPVMEQQHELVPQPVETVPVTDDINHMVVQDVPGDDALVNQHDYVPETFETEADRVLAVAAILKRAENLDAPRPSAATDGEGNPVVKGRTYELYGQNARGEEDIVPDVVQINQVTPETIQFTNLTAGQSQGSIRTADLGTAIRLVPHEHRDNAHGQVDNGNSDNTGYMGPGVDDLDTGGNSHANVRQAGRNFSLFEQHELIEEDGVARNIDQLDVAGTHYIEAPNDELFVVGW